MKTTQQLALACAFALIGTGAQATPITLNFDDVASGTLLNAAYGGLGVTFNATATVVRSGDGVTSQPNFASGSADYSTTLEIVFDNYGNSIKAYNVTNSSFTLRAYDANGTLLSSGMTSDFGPTGFVSLSNIGQIKYARFTSTGLYGIDDLSFDAVATTNVPEPATLASLVLGLGLMAGLRRRKQD
jgi:hypothetical protein